MQTQMVEFAANGGTAPGYLAHPTQTRRGSSSFRNGGG